MHLITMAHLGEAQGIIQKFNLHRLSPDVFKNDELVLILTVEGPFEAATKTALMLPQYPFISVLNLGISGTLDETYKTHHIYPVRTFYLIQDLKPAFKTFQGDPSGIDCLTCFERILDFQKAAKLKGLGTLVDREAWGVAMAAKTAGIPFQAYKLISDVAGSLGACELIKEEAELLSEKLASYLEGIMGIKVETNKLEIPGLHFTFTTQKRFETLLKKLQLKYDGDIELPIEMLKSEELHPKERARKLLDYMEDRLDPMRANLQKMSQELRDSFESKGIKLQLDPQWEKQSVQISFEAKNDQDLMEKSQALQSLSLVAFERVMNGELNVE